MHYENSLRRVLANRAIFGIASAFKSIDWVDAYCVFVNRLPAPYGSDAKHVGGVLSGIDFIVKDSIDALGFPTTNGTEALSINYPSKDHSLVARLKSLGAVCVGKANLDEMSYGWASDNPYFGKVTNPMYPNHSPGGSSGGCAAGVAGGGVWVAIGEDTVGSLRIPAAFCGVSACRAPLSTLDVEGICPLTSSGYDQAGLIANTLDDISLLDSLIHEYEELAPIEACKLQVAVATNFSLTMLSPEIEECMHNAIFKLASAGANIVMQEVPASFDRAAQSLTTMVNYEFAQAFNAYLNSRSHVPATLEKILENSDSATMRKIKALAFPPGRPCRPAYERAQTNARDIEQDVVDYFAQTRCHVLIHPTVGINVSVLEISSINALELARHVSVASCARAIAMNFSVMSPEGLPVGIEMLCDPAMDSRQAFAMCRTIEAIVKG
ncbi:amidase family protein [Pseudomonas sp. SDO55104_S430]